MTQSRAAPAGTGIGASIPRLELPRLAAGRGRYVDDIVLPRMVHAVFVRSPHAHARLVAIDTKEAHLQPGVVLHAVQVAQRPGIGELVQDDDRRRPRPTSNHYDMMRSVARCAAARSFAGRSAAMLELISPRRFAK